MGILAAEFSKELFETQPPVNKRMKTPHNLAKFDTRIPPAIQTVTGRNDNKMIHQESYGNT